MFRNIRLPVSFSPIKGSNSIQLNAGDCFICINSYGIKGLFSKHSFIINIVDSQNPAILIAEYHYFSCKLKIYDPQTKDVCYVKQAFDSSFCMYNEQDEKLATFEYPATPFKN